MGTITQTRVYAGEDLDVPRRRVTISGFALELSRRVAQSLDLRLSRRTTLKSDGLLQHATIDSKNKLARYKLEDVSQIVVGSRGGPIRAVFRNGADDTSCTFVVSGALVMDLQVENWDTMDLVYVAKSANVSLVLT